MPDEAARRRAGFLAEYSAPVVLSDGRAWHLPKPWLAIRPVFDGGRVVTHTRYLTCGPALDALIEAVHESETLASQVVAAVGLGAHMLLRNYDLSDDELGEVLVYRAGDPDSERMLRDIVSVATGRSAKKAGPAGAGSA